MSFLADHRPHADRSPTRRCEQLIATFLPPFSATSALLNFRAFPWVLGAESLDWITYAVGLVVSVAIALMLILLWHMPLALSGLILFGQEDDDE